MTQLISQLKQEHVEIMHTFASIKSGIASGKPGDGDLIKELRELKDVLVGHLGLEDKMLYPALAKSGEEGKKLGEQFSGEMLEISKIALAFFGKYMSETVSDLLKSSEFRKELNDIVKAVSKRVNAEETVLFPAYEKYCK